MARAMSAQFGNTGRLALSNAARSRLENLRPLFVRVGRETGVPAPLLAGIAWTESHFRSQVVNEIGCIGLMQICPVNFGKEFRVRDGGIIRLDKDSLKDPLTNIRAGALILVRQHKYNDQSIRASLAEYSGHVTADPSEYISNVLERALFLSPSFIYGSSG